MAPRNWQNLSLAEQIGNIGSEISRASHWEQKDDSINRERALERALELLSLTLADKRWQTRLKEITRFYEVLCDLLLKSKIYNISLKSLENYCVNFAWLSRKF